MRSFPYWGDRHHPNHSQVRYYYTRQSHPRLVKYGIILVILTIAAAISIGIPQLVLGYYSGNF